VLEGGAGEALKLDGEYAELVEGMVLERIGGELCFLS